MLLKAGGVGVCLSDDDVGALFWVQMLLALFIFDSLLLAIFISDFWDKIPTLLVYLVSNDFSFTRLDTIYNIHLTWKYRTSLQLQNYWGGEGTGVPTVPPSADAPEMNMNIYTDEYLLDNVFVARPYIVQMLIIVIFSCQNM